MEQAAGVQFKRGLLLSLAYASSATATIALIPILTKIAQHYAGAPNAAALVPMVLAISTLALALGSPFVGLAAERLGARQVLVLGLVLCGVSGIGSYIAGDLYQLLAWRVLAGVAMAAIIVAGNTLIGQYFQGAEQQRWIGLQMLVFGVVGVIVSLVAGWVGDLHWQWVLLMPVVVPVLVPLCFAWLSEVARGDGGAHAGPGVAGARFPLMAVLGVCAFTLVFSLLTFLPAYCMGFILAERGITSAAQAGYASAIVAFVAIPASAGFSAAAKVSMRVKLIISAGLSTAALLALLVPGLTGAMLSAAITGLVAGFGIPTLFAWLMATPPPALIGRAMGMLQTAMYLGQFLAPVVGVALAPAVGGWTVAAAYLAGAGLVLTSWAVFAHAWTARQSA